MSNKILLFVTAGLWICAGRGPRVYGAEEAVPAKPAPAAIDLSKFTQEMLRTGHWASLVNNKKTRGAAIRPAADATQGDCLRIDYRDQSTFGYSLKPVDLSGYDKIEFRMKGDGTRGIVILRLVDGSGNVWGYGPFFTSSKRWSANEVMLRFPTFGADKKLDLKNVVGIRLYANEYGARLEELVRQDFIMNTGPVRLDGKVRTVYVAAFKLAAFD